MIGHPHAQERWEHPEEEYYVAKHGLDASTNGKKSSDSEELEVDAGPKGSSKAKRMHPFGQGIRQASCQYLSGISLSLNTESVRCCRGCITIIKGSAGRMTSQ